MGSRLVFPDGEWIASDLEIEEVARRMASGAVIDADRKGKRVAVNPAHVAYAEEWDRPAAASESA
ncbi:unannotated protein [freshwater metagenome]|uniref:Unannotated protein n=1 Tax=freshwater metagenome TaxID=449393 RepID=A0A6J7ELH7_9ZZZZ|nr:hypothetical protein [Actinomycetota bacterium]